MTGVAGGTEPVAASRVVRLAERAVTRFGARRTTVAITLVAVALSVGVTLAVVGPSHSSLGSAVLLSALIPMASAPFPTYVLLRLAEELQVARGRLQRLASRDDLTGLWNRRHFHAEADRTIEIARARRAPVAVIIADLDDFKTINDQHGHATGDDLLAAVAARCSEAVDGGRAARHGGEEFAFLVEDVTREEAVACAERLRRAIAETEVACLAGQARTTASVGVAWDPVAAMTLSDLIRAADGAMYRSKRSGKNTVATAEGLTRRITDVPSPGTLAP